MAGHVGVTPVHLAAAYDNLDVAKALIDNESDPEATNQHGFSTIFELLHSPFVMDPALKAAIIIWIFQQEHFVVDVNGQDYQGNSTLGWFTQHHPKGVKLLLDHNAEVNLRAHDGATALHKAAARACGESVRLLMDSGADLAIIDMDGSAALVRAAEQGCLDVVKQLTVLSEDLKPDKTESPNWANDRPVQLLCERGMPGPSDVVNQIINTCSRPKATDQLLTSKIWHAVQQGYWSVVGCPDEKKDGPSKALLKAAISNDEGIPMQLLREGADPNTADADGNTPLSRACKNGHLNAVAILLKSGANPYALVEKTVSPLERAAGGGVISVSSRPFQVPTTKSLLPKNAKS